MAKEIELAGAFCLLLGLTTGCSTCSTGAEGASVPLVFPPIPGNLPDGLKSPLETLIASPDPHLRAESARRLGEAGEQARPVAQHLLVALGDPNRIVRSDVADALGQIGDPQAVAPLIATLEDAGEDWEVRASAARALGKLGDRRATKPLIAALAAMVSHVRLMASTALGEIGDPAAEKALRSTAKLDSDLGVRFAAIEALDKAFPAGNESQESSVTHRDEHAAEPAEVQPPDTTRKTP